MVDASLRSLHVVDPDQEARHFSRVLDAIAGFPQSTRAPRTGSSDAAEFGGLIAPLNRLEQKVAVLHAELVPLHRSRKCPRCDQLSLVLVTTRPHPDVSAEYIELHDVRCGCCYRGSRLYDPGNLLR